MKKNPTFCIFGGAQDTGNLGVSALGIATIQNLRESFPDCNIFLQQQCSKPKKVQIPSPSGAIEVESLFLHTSQRFQDRSGTRLIKALATASKFIPSPFLEYLNIETFQKILDVDVFFDVSGGDSFATIYGDFTFQAIVSFKMIPLILGKPLVLLPQTYGPFTGAKVRQQVSDIMSKCSLVASRDLNGLSELVNIVGKLDSRFFLCPDVAFTLSTTPISANHDDFFFNNDNLVPTLGLNISGLLYANRRNFGLSFDYNQLIDTIIAWFIEDVGGKVAFIPHVIETEKNASHNGTKMEDTDLYACKQIQLRLSKRFKESIYTINGKYNACEIKHIIGKCDFFIGARMHACIAAVSQYVPTVALAYSKKFDGVFGLAGVPQIVHDLRQSTIEDCINKIISVYTERDTLKVALTEEIQKTQKRIKLFFHKELQTHLQDDLD